MAGQQTLSPGEFVQALTDNTALFKNRGDDTAAKLLSRGTTMKVISDDGSYAKVELDDGNVGYVPSVQIGNPSQSMAADAGTGSEVQVWPPVGSTIPLPPADPGAPPGAPPEGAAGDGAPTLPPVIDPDAPAELPPLPDDAPTPGLGSAPPLEPAPAAEEAPKEKPDATETTADEETPSDAEME